MEGRGEFTHASGRVQRGSFRRNFLVVVSDTKVLSLNLGRMLYQPP
jgi:hypothetical protein